MKGPPHGVTTLSTVLLVAANLFLPVAIYIFGTGFFPYKPMLPGFSVHGDSENGPTPAAPFDRVVFMVVDALRSDFVYSSNSGFKFTQALIRDGCAIPFTAHATSPTVTMPRIKAITTGSIPSFLDAILNIAEGDKSSSLASQDTWLAQMKAKNTGKLVFYGDDTWLKLFPGLFDRAEGTSSFFVADFTEVDNNVTRHVPSELRNDDWNTLVLHYLGLDHIGHKGGPRSSNMLPKQVEMDGVVQQIYTAIETQPRLKSTLLVLLGDHGMNDAGNHGGSAPGETSPALLFISPKMTSLKRTFQVPLDWQEDYRYYSVIEQSDLAPTLGALLGFPVPRNNLGAFVVEFLPYWPRNSDQVHILMQNAEQILAILTATFGEEWFGKTTSNDPCLQKNSNVADIACRWRRLVSLNTMHKSCDAHLTPTISQWLKDAQRLLSNMASNYDINRLTVGQTLAITATVMAVFAAYRNAAEVSAAAVPFALVTIPYGVMVFASSYVEEEHHFWYHTATAWLAFIGWRGFRGTSKSMLGHLVAILVAIGTTRVIRSWNQTGQKFAGEPDVVKSFLHPKPVRVWALIGITYLWLLRELLQAFSGLPTALSTAGITGLVLSAFTFKLAFTNEDAPELVTGFARVLLDLTVSTSPSTTLTARAQAVFVGLAVATLTALYITATKHRITSRVSAVETLHHLYTLLALTQSRTTNIPLFLLHDILFRFLSAQALSLPELTLTTLLLQYASFFAHGGSNALSSVDLSSAYNGLRTFDIASVGLLTFVSNWAAPIFWVTATNVLLVRKRKSGEPAVFRRHVTLLTVFVTANVGFVMAACVALRTHLFVWTVFSPKYLYCAAWSLGQHLVVNVGLGGLLYWLGAL